MNHAHGQYLGSYLRAQLMTIEQVISSATSEQLLTNDSSYIEQLVNKFNIDPLQIRLDQAEITPHQRQVSAHELSPNILFGRGISRHDPRPLFLNTLTCHLPFTGDKMLFQFDPSSSCRMSLPKLNFDNGEISFEVTVNENIPNEASNLIKSYNSWIQQQVGFINTDLTAHNNSLRPYIQKLVTNEKGKRSKLTEAISSIGIPIREPQKNNRVDVPATLVQFTNNKYYSVALSYGGTDIVIAKKIHDFLTKHGVGVWFYPEDSEPGDKLHRMMTRMVNDADRIILLCSKNSLHRQGVLNELERVLEREANEAGSAILIPIALDDYVFDAWKPERKDHAIQLRARNILSLDGNDFEGEETQALLSKLLSALTKK